MAPSDRQRVKLVKVAVQPTFVVVDAAGEILDEFVPQPLIVKASDWATYPAEGFEEARRTLEDQLNAAGGLAAMLAEPVPANREQRRKSTRKKSTSRKKTTARGKTGKNRKSG